MITLLLACNGAGSDSALPEPGPLMAGMAEARIPAPIGIGTSGYGGFGSDLPDSDSPFAEIYPATKNLHGHPQISAVVLSRGEPYESVFVRVDAVGVFQQLRRAIVLGVEAESGRDIDDALLMGATHTHSGPGRIVDGGGIFDLIADRYFPEFYRRFVDEAVGTILLAYEDLAPARLGSGSLEIAGAHEDRRCEDGLDYTNDTTPVLAVEREGRIEALILAYAIHGTGLGIDQLTLSQDVSGAIEEAVEDGFEHPVQVMMFNSWGADMSPGDPAVFAQEGGELPEGFDRLERVGVAVSEALHAELDGLSWEDEPSIRLRTERLYIDREHIGYADDEFPYEYGGVYCSGDDDCDPETVVEGLDTLCIPFPETWPAPNQSVMTVGEVGGFQVVTFPGEPGTKLGEQVIAEMQGSHGAGDVLFLGYTQDYLGYSILEEDWWQGGYEASGALWGPRQGAYLAECAAGLYGAWAGQKGFPGPEPIVPFDDPEFTPYAPETALSLGEVLEPVQASYGAGDVIRFVVAGSDAWLGAPLATVVDADGEELLRPGGQVLDSDGYSFWVEHRPEPSYEDVDEAGERVFAWAFHLPVQHTTPGKELPDGSYRMRVVLPSEEGDRVVESELFEVAR